MTAAADALDHLEFDGAERVEIRAAGHFRGRRFAFVLVRCASDIGGDAALPHPRRLRQDAHRDATRSSRYGVTNVQLPQT